MKFVGCFLFVDIVTLQVPLADLHPNSAGSKVTADENQLCFAEQTPSFFEHTWDKLNSYKINSFCVNFFSSHWPWDRKSDSIAKKRPFAERDFYFKIIYLHIIGMKTGWYICDGTGQIPYRNVHSIQKPLFQTWTKWINILVNKYISDMSLYWNVLLYIKYNTILFLFLLFSFCTQYIQKYTDISHRSLEGSFFLIKKAV